MSELYEFDNFKDEMIDGKIIFMSPSANPRHGMVIANLSGIFYNYLKGKPCRVFGDNLDVYFNEKNYVTPDICIVCDKSKITKNGYKGVPSLIVEVLSPSSIEKDRFEKFELYEKFGVPEYWIIDYNNETIEKYVLKDGKYSYREIFSLLDESEFNRLPKEAKEKYTTNLKVYIFDGLEIDLQEVFDWDF